MNYLPTRRQAQSIKFSFAFFFFGDSAFKRPFHLTFFSDKNSYVNSAGPALPAPRAARDHLEKAVAEAARESEAGPDPKDLSRHEAKQKQLVRAEEILLERFGRGLIADSVLDRELVRLSKDRAAVKQSIDTAKAALRDRLSRDGTANVLRAALEDLRQRLRRIWLVIAMRITSGRSRLYRSELTTTAGRLLIVVWSVKGKGTTTTSPKRSAIGDSVNPVVDVVFGIAPSLAERRFRGTSRRPNQLAIGVSLCDEVDEVLHLRHALGREPN